MFYRRHRFCRSRRGLLEAGALEVSSPPMFGAKPSKLPQEIAFLLVPNFSMIAFTSAIEPLRLANRASGKELYRWRLFSPEGKAVRASNGIELTPEGGIDQIGGYQTVILCSGIDGHLYEDKNVFAALSPRRFSCSLPRFAHLVFPPKSDLQVSAFIPPECAILPIDWRILDHRPASNLLTHPQARAYCTVWPRRTRRPKQRVSVKRPVAGLAPTLSSAAEWSCRNKAAPQCAPSRRRPQPACPRSVHPARARVRPPAPACADRDRRRSRPG